MWNLFLFNCDKRREKFWSQLCIRGYTGKAGESVPERVDEFWVVGAEGGGELALLLPAARRVDQHLHLGVVKSVEFVPTAPDVELVEILKIMISTISESEDLLTLTYGLWSMMLKSFSLNSRCFALLASVTFATVIQTISLGVLRSLHKVDIRCYG